MQFMYKWISIIRCKVKVMCMFTHLWTILLRIIGFCFFCSFAVFSIQNLYMYCVRISIRLYLITLNTNYIYLWNDFSSLFFAHIWFEFSFSCPMFIVKFNFVSSLFLSLLTWMHWFELRIVVVMVATSVIAQYKELIKTVFKKK